MDMKSARLGAAVDGTCVINEDMYTFSKRAWIGWARPAGNFGRERERAEVAWRGGTCSETRLTTRRQRVERAVLHRSEQYERISVGVMS